jgi:hypothetical protein
VPEIRQHLCDKLSDPSGWRAPEWARFLLFSDRPGGASDA